MRRALAAGSLVLFAIAAAALVADAITSFPRGLVIAASMVVALVVAWAGIRRTGAARTVILAVGVAVVVAAVVYGIIAGLAVDAILPALCVIGAVGLATRTFDIPNKLPTATPPSHPVVIWNPRSGGGKAVKANLADEARARGITPIELTPGSDIVALVRDAIAGGADAIAAAGGDGTQALVASVAAAHDLPFACIPAGTRNHFALDLGVDRDDVVGALDAFVAGGERRVDLAEVNGRTFVNNVSLGLYAEAVQRRGYRDAKLRTILDTVPQVLGTNRSGDSTLRWSGPDGVARNSAAMILISNNVYRLGRVLASGTRPRLDAGVLGIAVADVSDGTGSRGIHLLQWAAPDFEVDSTTEVPAGVDGEALLLERPLRFSIHPNALRVRIAPHHPGASPSSMLPDGIRDGVGRLLAISSGRN
jgi:diacylglycerol kinase family enzyme